MPPCHVRPKQVAVLPRCLFGAVKQQLSAWLPKENVPNAPYDKKTNRNAKRKQKAKKAKGQ